MKAIRILNILLLVITTQITAQVIQFSGNEWEDPSIFEINQTEPRAFHTPYDGTDFSQKSENNYVISLNGNWKFKLFETPEMVPENFHTNKSENRSWDDISVPSNWQMEGFGHPKFRNIALTYESDPPLIPDYYNPTGCYKKGFTIDREWEGREIFLRFEGVKSAAYIWINGNPVGYNQGGFEPAEFNVTNFVKKGKNEIAVKVLRFSDGSYLENQDMWRLSGIFRDVKLYALPKVHIHDFFHYSDFEPEYKDASVKAAVTISNANKYEISDYLLMVDILNDRGKSILMNGKQQQLIHIESNTYKIIEIEAEAIAPRKWSAEAPNLYKISYKLVDSEGEIIESFSKKFGFREIEIVNDIFYLNGTPLKLNAVNSHMHHPGHGQAVPTETLWKDLLLMKQHNINAVRTSHYPPSPEYLEMADKIGMYIIDEVGDEAHQNTQLSYDTTYTEMYRDRASKLVHRDRNHPSVIIWSAGNESGSGPNIYEVIKTGKQIDPTRPGWMYGGNNFYIPFEDITGPRYWIPYQLENLARGKILEKNDLRPAFMDEYLAATGNGLGGMDEYWKIIRREPRVLGGAIWDWVSPGINTPIWVTYNSSAHDIHPTIMGRPIFTDGFGGKGLKLSGHDDWVEFYRDPILEITGKELTLSAMVKICKIPQSNNIIMKGSHQYGLYINETDELVFYVQHNNNLDTLQSPYFRNESKRSLVKYRLEENFYNEWHHIAGIYTGTELELYIDYELKNSVTCSLPIAASPFPLCIGRNAEKHDQGEHSGRLSCMTIDDVIIMDISHDINVLKRPAKLNDALVYLNFEEEHIKDSSFYAVGLGGRTYGLIWPDRVVQPELKQVKKSGQPVSIECINKEKGIFRIINMHHFTDLSEFRTMWTTFEDGILIDSGLLKLQLLPLDTTFIKIPYPKLKSTGEILLNISLVTVKEKIWAKSGFEIAWEEFILQEPMHNILYPDQDVTPAAFFESDTSITVFGDQFKYTFSKHEGSLSSMVFNNSSFIESGPVFNVWRAPLANDIDPWGSYRYSDEKKTEGLGRSIDNQLRTLGLRHMKSETINTEIIPNESEEIVIEFQKVYHGTNLRSSFMCNEKVSIYSDGTLKYEFNLEPRGVMPDILPKAGWQLKIPKKYNEIKWYGRGPFETYPDRKTGAKTGIYQSDADHEYMPYIIPQDYGNHSDTRWVKLSNGNGTGMRISGDIIFNFSYHKYDTDNLSRAFYTHQLQDAPHYSLNIDPIVSGVGGTAIRQLQQYRQKPQAIQFTLWIEPF